VITKELVDRINELARKQRSTGLNEEEKEEQHNLRQQYLQCIRTQVVDALDSAGIKPKALDHSNCSCPTCKGDKKVH